MVYKEARELERLVECHNVLAKVQDGFRFTANFQLLEGLAGIERNAGLHAKLKIPRD